MEPAFAWAMPEAASAHKAATATHADTSQQRTDRTRRTSADPQRAQQGATAAAADAPAALNTLSRLQQLANASPQVAQLRWLQALANARFAPVAQLAGGPEEELIQGKFASAELQPQLQQAPRANNTGLPDQLKSGIESLSGMSLDHVRVHYNSSQPAQLNALAYAQGSDIHLAPGQEHHLPHEAWHVVQQAQGRVRPTMQMRVGVQVNDDVGLEREADVMGTKALERGHRADETHRSISMPIETAQQIEGDTTNSPDVNVANNHSAGLANGRGSAQRGGYEVQGIADQRPEAALQRQVQVWGDGSKRVGQLRALQSMGDAKDVGGKRQDLTLGFAINERVKRTIMNTLADKMHNNKSHSVANEIFNKPDGEPSFQSVDNRDDTIVQRKLQTMANDRPQAKQLVQLLATAGHAQSVIQRLSRNYYDRAQVNYGDRALAHLTQGKLEEYLWGNQSEIAVGQKNTILIGEGLQKGYAVYGCIKYNCEYDEKHDRHRILVWHAHDQGRMG
jgi:hypothetical protein